MHQLIYDDKNILIYTRDDFATFYDVCDKHMNNMYIWKGDNSLLVISNP